MTISRLQPTWISGPALMSKTQAVSELSTSMAKSGHEVLLQSTLNTRL